MAKSKGNSSEQGTQATQATQDRDQQQIANLTEVAATIGKAPGRVRALLNDGVKTSDGTIFKLAYDLFTVPGTKVQLRIITADSVAEYQKLAAAGMIGTRRGSNMVAYTIWLPKGDEQALLDVLASHGIDYKARGASAASDDDDDDTASDTASA